MTNSSILEIQNLTKYYEGKVEPAVDNLSLEIFKGEIFGLLGPNGAGKTTTISILCSLLKPSSGKISVAGLDLNHHLNEIKSRIGVVAQEIALYDKLTAYENLYYFGRLYGVDKQILNQEIDFYLDRLSLTNYKNQKIKNFSGGMKRRLLIARALIHEPKLLISDEPTAGVDVELRRGMWDYLKELNKNGTTILLTTHYLEEVEQLCKNMAIIKEGIVFKQDSVKNMLRTLEMEKYMVDVRNVKNDTKIKGYEIKVIDKTTLEVDVKADQPITDLIKALDKADIQVNDIRPKSNRMEQLFLNALHE